MQKLNCCGRQIQFFIPTKSKRNANENNEIDFFTYHTDSTVEYLIPSVHKNMVKHALSYTAK